MVLSILLSVIRIERLEKRTEQEVAQRFKDFYLQNNRDYYSQKVDDSKFDDCAYYPEISRSSVKDLVNRINYYRYLAGVPPIEYDKQYEPGLIRACHAINKTRKISHNIEGYPCVDAAAIEAARRSNLGLTSYAYHPADAVDQYMIDRGENNLLSYGHRAWLLVPTTKTMAYGQYGSYHGIRVSHTSTQPVTEDLPFYAFPGPGPFPRSLVAESYSFYFRNFQEGTPKLTKFDVDGQSYLDRLKQKYVDGKEGTTPRVNWLFDLDTAMSIANKAKKIDVEVTSGKDVYQYTIRLFNADGIGFCMCALCAQAPDACKMDCPLSYTFFSISNSGFCFPDYAQTYCKDNSGDRPQIMQLIKDAVIKHPNEKITFQIAQAYKSVYKTMIFDYQSIRYLNATFYGKFGYNDIVNQYIVWKFKATDNEMKYYFPNDNRNHTFTLRDLYLYDSRFSDAKSMTFNNLDLDFRAAADFPENSRSNKVIISLGDRVDKIHFKGDTLTVVTNVLDSNKVPIMFNFRPKNKAPALNNVATAQNDINVPSSVMRLTKDLPKEEPKTYSANRKTLNASTRYIYTNKIDLRMNAPDLKIIDLNSKSSIRRLFSSTSEIPSLNMKFTNPDQPVKVTYEGDFSSYPAGTLSIERDTDLEIVQTSTTGNLPSIVPEVPKPDSSSSAQNGESSTGGSTESTNANGDASKATGGNSAAVVGGVIGAIVILAVVGVAGFFAYKMRGRIIKASHEEESVV